MKYLIYMVILLLVMSCEVEKKIEDLVKRKDTVSGYVITKYGRIEINHMYMGETGRYSGNRIEFFDVDNATWKVSLSFDFKIIDKMELVRDMDLSTNIVDYEKK